MSRIPDLGPKYVNLPSILTEYENEIVDVEKLIQIKGKTIEKANMENPSWLHYYDHKKIELHTLVKYFDNEVQRVRGTLFKSYKENYSRELSEREINRYIDHEKAYLDIYELYLEVKEVFEKYESVVNSFTARGYALNNITRARVSEVHDVVL